MSTFHQNLVQSFLNFKNKYMRQYDTYEDAVDDIDNIPEGGIFYTNDNSSVQDIIDGMTALHLAGSQVGAGTKNFTFNTEAQKRMLCITKKSGVIVESKEIPTDVLSTGDVVPLGQTAPIIGTDNINSRETLWTDGVNKQLEFENDEYGGLNYGGYKTVETSPKNIKGADRYIGLAADISKTTGASLTYNGNNSFTITVTDSTLSVYVYVDMLVLGGSASGRNVSFDAAGTSLESTDVEGAIKEVNADLTELERRISMPILNYANPLHTFSANNLSYTTTKECWLMGSLYQGTGGDATLTIDGTTVALSRIANVAMASASVGSLLGAIHLKAGSIITVNHAQEFLHVYEEI